MFLRDNQSNASRSTLFWAWDDKLENEELKRQIVSFFKEHYAGFFMHSRDGLETPYLSEEWDDAILFSAKEAEKRGMEAWLYDEDRFPSGTCSGLVSKDEEYALHGLTIEVTDTYPEEDIRAAYIANVDRDEIKSFRRIMKEERKDSSEKYLIVRFETSKGSVWFNGSAPPDNLNPDTVQRFISLTHEHYRKLLGSLKSVPGIFTDEPSLADRHASFNPKRSWMPWSYGMEEYYTELTGNDIYDTFPLLFFSAEGSSKARYDYWRVIARRFEECYSEAIGTWCRENGYIFTGHYLQEDKLGLQTRVSGSEMPHYTHEDIPGIDLLSERCDEYLTVKQAASVAHQWGKKRVIAETFAACGWDFTLTGQKWITDWEYALGVTNKVEHLALYSLRGCRKRDYPASFNAHSPFFQMQHAMEDYSSRLSALLQQGEHLTDTLIIHPMTTVWCRFGSSAYGNPKRREERDLKENDELGFRLSAFIKMLENSLIAPDLGDETLIERKGSVEGGIFSIGQASYSKIVLPWMENITSPLLSLLEKFEGLIIVLGAIPHMLDGIESTQPEKILSDKAIMIERESDAIPHLSHSPLLDIKGKENGELIMQARKSGDEYLFFIVNNDRENAFSGTVQANIRGRVSEYDLLTGEERIVETDDMTWSMKMEGAESQAYIINTSMDEARPRECIESRTKETKITLPDTLPIKLDMPNVLTLDKAAFAIDGKTLNSDEALPVWMGEDRIRKSLGMFSVDTDEITQRYLWIHDKHPGDGHIVSLTFSFQASDEIENAKLALETPDEFRIIFNGNEIKNVCDGFYLDRAFRTVAIPTIRKGTNTVTLITEYHLASALEAIYVIGDFSVSKDRVIGKSRQELKAGSWTEQGLLHYPGIVTYMHKFRKPEGRVFIELPRVECSAKSISINGHLIELPFDYQKKAEITEFIEDENTLEINVYGSPRNMLGQLHMKGGKPVFSNPYSFVPDDKDYDPGYSTVSYGMMEMAVIIEER